MRKYILILLIAFVLPSCANLDSTLEVMEVLLTEEPTVVCDKESVGVVYENKMCVKLSDNSYVWK